MTPRGHATDWQAQGKQNFQSGPSRLELLDSESSTTASNLRAAQASTPHSSDA